MIVVIITRGRRGIKLGLDLLQQLTQTARRPGRLLRPVWIVHLALSVPSSHKRARLAEALCPWRRSNAMVANLNPRYGTGLWMSAILSARNELLRLQLVASTRRTISLSRRCVCVAASPPARFDPGVSLFIALGRRKRVWCRSSVKPRWLMSGRRKEDGSQTGQVGGARWEGWVPYLCGRWALVPATTWSGWDYRARLAEPLC